MNTWLPAQPAEVFTGLLPLLLRTVGSFTPGEQRELGERVLHACSGRGARDRSLPGRRRQSTSIGEPEPRGTQSPATPPGRRLAAHHCANLKHYQSDYQTVPHGNAHRFRPPRPFSAQHRVVRGPERVDGDVGIVRA